MCAAGSARGKRRAVRLSRRRRASSWRNGMAGARPILIAGGGLGGLTAALALGRKGRAVRVLEQAEKFAPIGYGIQLGPNVFPMFERIGVTAAVMREATI